MATKPIYDPDIEKMLPIFPRFNWSDATGSRRDVENFIKAMVEKGAKRATNDQIQELERTVPRTDAPDVPIRIYMPKDRPEAGSGFINFHGGGFILGDLESEHPRCLLMAAEGGAVSIGVDYRLAPEHPFPAGVEDCYAVLEWVFEHATELKIDPTRIVIGGASAGGTLTAAVALMARDQGGPEVASQMLLYPALDDRCETPSTKNGFDLPVWNSQNAIDMWTHYIGEDRSNVSPYAAPARTQDLSGLPAAFIMTCEHDPLRDEAINYAMRLMEAGVPVELHNYPGTVHGFNFLIPADISTRAVNEELEAFKRAVGR